MGSKTPDQSGINAAAVQQAAISKEALDFYKQQYADQAPDRAKAADVAYKVSEQQLASSQLSDSIAKDYNDYNKETFRPLEKSIVSDAANYDTPERQKAAADSAVSDVNQAVSAQRQASMREMARSGVMPDSGKMMAVMDAGDIGAAKASAGAAYSARKDVETQGHARMMDAASLGRNLPSNQATSASVATATGNSAVTNATVPSNLNSAAVAQMGQGYSLSSQANSAAGNLYGQISAQNASQAASNRSSTNAAAGTVASMAAAYF